MNRNRQRPTIALLVAAVIILAGTWSVSAANLADRRLDETRINLSLDAAEVGDILRLLAAQGELNLSVAGTVEGQVTTVFDNVTLRSALDVIAASAGADWYLLDNIVVVKPANEQHRQQVVTEIFRLQFIAAQEAQKFVAPLIPTGGSVEALSRMADGAGGGWEEMIQVSAPPDVITTVRNTIHEIDQPRPMVEIEARIIETNVSSGETFGINWPDALQLHMGGLDDAEGEGTATATGFASYPLGGGSWTWGTLTAGEVSFIIDFLVQNGNSRLLSNPRVTTMSNREATIDVFTTIPIQTLNRFTEGAVVQDIVSFQDLDVGLTLRVTPRVTSDSTILLDVSSVVEEITGYTGPADNQRPITSKREVTSAVGIRAGETLGIGGLMKDAERETVEKIPLLGSIPLLGKLFQHRTTTTEKTDLLILITPHIVSSE